jgi:hypothetical protein
MSTHMLFDNRTLLFMVFRDTPIQSILLLKGWFLIIAFAVIFSQFAHNGGGCEACPVIGTAHSSHR